MAIEEPDVSVPNVNCMTCMVQLAQGCPTNGRTCVWNGITHALVTIAGTHFDGTRNVKAHGFRWSEHAGRWMFFLGFEAHWATRDQR